MFVSLRLSALSRVCRDSKAFVLRRYVQQKSESPDCSQNAFGIPLVEFVSQTYNTRQRRHGPSSQPSLYASWSSCFTR